MAPDPNVSAVVHLQAPERPETEPVPASGPQAGALTQQDIAKAKSHFTSAGFEVHAPLGLSFSIGGKRSLFERVFGQALSVDEETVGASVRTEGGGLDLPIEGLPDDIRARVRAVTFVEPPPLIFADQ